MFTQAAHALHSKFSKTFETEHVKAMRGKLKLGMHTGKMIATAVLVTTVALAALGLLFGTCIGGGFGTFWNISTLLVSCPITLLAHDAYKATDKGYLLADKPENFTKFNYPDITGKEKLIQQCHSLVNQTLQGTLILKHINSFIFDRYVETISEFIHILEKKERP